MYAFPKTIKFQTEMSVIHISERLFSRQNLLLIGVFAKSHNNVWKSAGCMNRHWVFGKNNSVLRFIALIPLKRELIIF